MFKKMIRFGALLVAALYLATASFAANPSATLMTNPLYVEFNNNGQPLAGGMLYTYYAGTNVPLATFTDATLLYPNPNPVILDQYGKAQVWFSNNAYKVNLTDALGVQQPDYPVDNLRINTVSGTSLAALPGAGLVGYSYSQSYPSNTVGSALQSFSSITAGSDGSSLIGNNSNLAGSVGRTQHSKNLDIISVMDFGATGNGTTDDTAAINLALAWVAAVPNRGLVFPYGLYSVSQVTMTNAVKAHIQMNGAVLVGNTSGIDSVFKMVACVECSIYGAGEFLNYSNYTYSCGLSIQASIASGFTATCNSSTVTLVTAPTVGALAAGNLIFIQGNYATLGSLASGTANTGGAVYNISSASSGWATVSSAVLGYTTTGNACSTRINISGLTFNNFQIGIKQGLYNVDAQNSECVYHGINWRNCGMPFWGGGSQTGASFMGCNICSEMSGLAGALTSMRFDGGFWYISGGELTQESNTPGSTCISVTPAYSTNTAYGCGYPIVKLSSVHIENQGTLLYLYNPLSVPSPTGAESSIAFDNCSGWIPQNSLNPVIDTTGDSAYSGKIRFGNGNWFYGTASGPTRGTAHIALGAATQIDLDGTPFGYSFNQGLSALLASYTGNPRLRGETILARTGATTTITTAWTTVNFPTDAGTSSSSYGAIFYSSGVFTAPHAMVDVIVSGQLEFGTSTTANLQIYAGGVVVANLGPITGNVIPFFVVIPTLAAGGTIYVQLSLTSGSQALAGTILNSIHIQART